MPSDQANPEGGSGGRETPDCNPESAAPKRPLTASVSSACHILAATVTGRTEEVAQRYREALRRGVPAPYLAETARCAHLLGGFPRALQGLQELARALAEAGQTLPELDAEDSRAAHAGRGAETFRAIYGEQAEPVLQRLAEALPGYDRWILEHAYGRVLSRPGIPLAERELMIVAALTVLDCPLQLVSHARGALRCGASPEQLGAVLELLRERHGDEPVERAHERLRELLARAAREPS